MKKLLFALFIATAGICTANAYPVSYNVKTRIYHSTSCTHAQRCTKNCITIDHTDAIKRGGRPCHTCGGH